MSLRYIRTAAIVAAFWASGLQAVPSGPLGLDVGVLPLEQVETVVYPALDLERVAAEDALRASQNEPRRFAIGHETAIDVRRAGTWEDLGERSIWRYRVQAEGAVSLNFGFTHYRLPPSARLYIYDSTGAQLAGPWDWRKNEPHGQLWTPVITAADVVIELDVARAERDRVELLLGQVNQGYRGFGGRSEGYREPDIGQPKYPRDGDCSPEEVLSGTCNMDVACLGDDDPWNDPRRAVGAITRNGVDTCTGSLLNNTSGDRRRLFATASHCRLTAATAASVVIYWNYEWPTCRTPGSSASGQTNPPSAAMSSSGTSFVAATPDPFNNNSSAPCNSGMEPTCSDWTMVEVDDPFDPAWNLFWEGWDRRSAGALCADPGNPTSTAGLCASIHHPGVDEKRITFVQVPLTVSGIAAGQNTHWHANWDPTPPILPNIQNPPPSLPPGVTEGGSSGSPLFSPERRIVGVLSGGYSACGATGANLSDDYGQLAIAWEGRGTPTTRMRDHLDPLGTGVEFIDGMGMSPFQLALDPPTLAVCAATTPSTSVDVDVSADPGFAGSVALGATGLPPGTSANFVPPAVNAPGTSVMTISGFTAAAAGVHDASVTGTSGGDSYSRGLRVSVAAAMPGVVGLAAPVDGATGVSTGVTLSWSAAGSGPIDYLVEVATDAAFGNVIFSRTVSDGTSVPVNPVLAPLTTYYWRVRAGNGCGNAAWSTPRSFTTGVTFPEPYCPVTFPSGVEPITLVKLSGIDNRSPANGGPPHQDFTGVSGGTVEAGQSYQIAVEGNTMGSYTTRVNAYIDWNRNGSFEAGEGYVIGDITNSTGTDGQQAVATIAVPPGVTNGPVRMRVLKKWSTPADACNSSGYGQAEDYTLQVGQPIQSYTVGGTVSGLPGRTVVLRLNGGAPLAVGNGAYVFPQGLDDGSAYEVTASVGSGVICTVDNATGTIQGANVTDVDVICAMDERIFVNGFEGASP